MEVPRAFVHLKPISPSRVQVRMLFSGDPHIDYVPQTLISWAVKTIVWKFMVTMKSKAETQGANKGDSSLYKVLERKIGDMA